MPANPREPGTPTVTQAVRELRVKLGDTQQQFAQRLGLAISTVVRYESTRPPRAEVLSRLYKVAVENELHDVAAMFHEAIIGEVSGGLASGYFPLQGNERAVGTALVGILRNARHLPELRKPAQAALKAIADGFRLIEKRHKAGTMIFSPHEEVASDEFWNALEALQRDLPGKGQGTVRRDVLHLPGGGTRLIEVTVTDGSPPAASEEPQGTAEGEEWSVPK